MLPCPRPFSHTQQTSPVSREAVRVSPELQAEQCAWSHLTGERSLFQVWVCASQTHAFKRLSSPGVLGNFWRNFELSQLGNGVDIALRASSRESQPGDSAQVSPTQSDPRWCRGCRFRTCAAKASTGSAVLRSLPAFSLITANSDAERSGFSFPGLELREASAGVAGSLLSDVVRGCPTCWTPIPAPPQGGG